MSPDTPPHRNATDDYDATEHFLREEPGITPKNLRWDLGKKYGGNSALNMKGPMNQGQEMLFSILMPDPYSRVRDGAAKGKVERFFRTVRDQFLIRALDLSSLEALNRQFTEWVEEQYNAQPHSVLGMAPLDRYALDRSRVRFLPPNEANDEMFFVEEDRLVRTDNTFSFKSMRFEAPRHLPDRTIQVRYRRSQPTARLVIYYKGERMGEARPLNMIANDRKPIVTQEA